MKKFTQKFIGLLALLFITSFTVNAQENSCDGDWVEDIVTYNCGSFDHSATECNNHPGCYYEYNAYVGVYLWEDNCWGGTHTIDNSYCDEGTNVSDNPCSSISILLSQGWNMIGFACSENTNAINAFAAIKDKILIAKDGEGNAYLPDWDYNGIGDLERGYGYSIKVTEEISNYNICE